jgi:hypothetical protein
MKLTTRRVKPWVQKSVLVGTLLGLTAQLAACGGGSTAAATPDAAAQSPLAVCGRADHVKVGQVANLRTLSHQVSGKVTVIDNCTIEFTAFTYDGLGLPDVFVYAAKGGNYGTGFAVGSNLFGKPLANATFRVTLKDGQLDNLDGVSIWCVRAAVSFGDGLFAKPL